MHPSSSFHEDAHAIREPYLHLFNEGAQYAPTDLLVLLLKDRSGWIYLGDTKAGVLYDGLGLVRPHCSSFNLKSIAYSRLCTENDSLTAPRYGRSCGSKYSQMSRASTNTKCAHFAKNHLIVDARFLAVSLGTALEHSQVGGSLRV